MGGELRRQPRDQTVEEETSSEDDEEKGEDGEGTEFDLDRLREYMDKGDGGLVWTDPEQPDAGLRTMQNASVLQRAPKNAAAAAARALRWQLRQTPDAVAATHARRRRRAHTYARFNDQETPSTTTARRRHQKWPP